jgi:hypothetical protein
LIWTASALSVSGLLTAEVARASCDTPSGPCPEAETLWASPASQRFVTISDAPATPDLRLGASASAWFRWRPAVLEVPAPNAEGREVNVVAYATDLSLGFRFGIGNRMELTLALPVGLYQRGAGIKGITYQNAQTIAAQGLHDPRLGFGFVLPPLAPWLNARVRFEAKLPLGSEQTLSGEQGAVASPSLAVVARTGGLFGGAELGARLRAATNFYGSRIGSQGLLALGVGYELAQPRLALTVEAYALPSLIAAGTTRHLPAEWLASLHYTPNGWSWLTFGAGGGTGLPWSNDGEASFSAFGVPAYRVLAFARFTPEP